MLGFNSDSPRWRRLLSYLRNPEMPSKRLLKLNEGACPDCDSRLFHPGPRGGGARNVKCTECGSKFWYGPPFPPMRIDNEDQLYDYDRRVALRDMASAS